MSSKKNNFVFVYGTLQRGGRFHDAIDQKPLGRAYLDYSNQFKMVDVRGSYPALVNTTSGYSQESHDLKPTVIHGEVYAVDDATMDQLDMIEGYPSLYAREVVTATFLGERRDEFGFREDVRCWVYYMEDAPENCPDIPSGMWNPIKNQAV